MPRVLPTFFSLAITCALASTVALVLGLAGGGCTVSFTHRDRPRDAGLDASLDASGILDGEVNPDDDLSGVHVPDAIL